MATTTELERIQRVGDEHDPIDLYMVASSFEPRSVRATSLVRRRALSRAVIFSYEDTLDTVLGQDHARQIRDGLRTAAVPSIDVLPCRFSEPYGAMRVLHAFLLERELMGTIRSVLVDITCFTKLHLLTLLRYIERELKAEAVTVCYTEPLAYASAFGKSLSYGIQRSVYLPYESAVRRSGGIGLLAFLGHERVRLEYILQELEPDIAVIMLGEPGFTLDMAEYSKRTNESLIHRSTYDRQYRLVTVPTKDVTVVRETLEAEVGKMSEAGCDSVYLAPLGTKLQALAIDALRRTKIQIRMLLAYTIPRRYERRLYSQGSGPTYRCVLYDRSSGR